MKRLGLAPASVQGDHEVRGEALPQRELREGGRDQVDHERVLTERETGIGEFLDCDGAQIVQPRDLSARYCNVLDVDQCVSAPQVEGLRELRYCSCGITGTDRLASEQSESFEVLRIELVGFDTQEVAARDRREARARAVRVASGFERLAEPADVHAQRSRRARRRAASPELVDQLLGCDRPVRPDRQEREQLSRLRATDLHGRAVVTQLDWPEDSQLQLRLPRRRGHGTANRSGFALPRVYRGAVQRADASR